MSSGDPVRNNQPGFTLCMSRIMLQGHDVVLFGFECKRIHEDIFADAIAQHFCTRTRFLVIGEQIPSHFA